MNGQQFPVNPKWLREMTIASLNIQNHLLELAEKWAPPTPAQPMPQEQPQPDQMQQGQPQPSMPQDQPDPGTPPSGSPGY